jgi:hypothetical protein
MAKKTVPAKKPAASGRLCAILCVFEFWCVINRTGEDV